MSANGKTRSAASRPGIGGSRRCTLLSGTALTLALLGSSAFAADYGSPGSPLPGDGIFASADSGVSITMPAGDRIFVTDDGIEAHAQTGDITIDFGGEISAGDSGIEAFITGNGTIDIHVTSTGVIKGTAMDGIYARIDGIGDGGSNGIGDGNILIDHDGAIGSFADPMNGFGILAWITNPNSYGRIDIDVSGTICAALPGNKTSGIEARQDGKGTVSVVADFANLCPVPSSDILIIVSNDISGADDGIYASTNAGNISISTLATSHINVTEDGIEAHTDNHNITIDVAGEISAGDSAVEAIVAGSGSIDIHILPTGFITGSAEDGIYARIDGIGDGGSDGIGDGNILINHEGVIGTASDPVGRYGIFAWISNLSSDGNILIDVTGSICAAKQGDFQGIRAINDGVGTTTINAAGGTFCGIVASNPNPNNDDDIDVNAGGTIVATDKGISASSAGDGDISVAVHANSTIMAGNTGIYAHSAGAGNVSVLVGDGVDIDPADFGIYATTPMSDVTIVLGDTTTITVDDTDHDNVATGILAKSGKPADGIDPTIEIEIGEDNVIAVNSALAAGKGDNAFGIVAVTYNNGGTAGIALTAEDGLSIHVKGDASAGIVATTRDLFGASTYTGNGDVSIKTGDGSIVVQPGNNVVVAGGLSGSYGILAASGAGDVSIVSELDIDVSAGTGVRAFSNTGNVTVVAGPITGGRNGIVATTGGSGAARVATAGAIDGGTLGGGAAISITGGTGTATGNDGIGVGIFHDVRNNLGTGLRATSTDGGTIKITSAGVVSGLGQGTAWVMELSGATGRIFTIDNAGTIKSIASNPDHLAIRALGGGHVILNNSGTIRGRLDFSAIESVIINNTGSLSWHTAGASKFSNSIDLVFNGATGLIATNAGGLATSFDFGGGIDLFRNAGLLAVGEGAQAAATLTLSNLEIFNNAGTIVLGWNGASVTNPVTDGATNDKLVASSAAFVGSGDSALRIDAFLGNQGTADRMTLALIGGRTSMFVRDANANGPGAFNEILVVDSLLSTKDAFRLAGANVSVTNSGKKRVINKGLVDYVLDERQGDWYLKGIPSKQSKKLSSIAAGWLDDWHDDDYENKSSRSFRDFASHLTGAQGEVSDGGALWIRGLPSHDSLDGTRSFTNMGGIAFGADVVTPSPDGHGLTLGFYGSYDSPRAERHFGIAAAQTETWKFGAYLSNGRAFADMTVKTDTMDGGFRDPEAPQFAAPLEGRNSGAQMNAGYRFGGADFYLEPLATFSYVGTKINGVQLMGGSVSFDDVTSMRGRLAARMGGEWKFAGGAVLRPFVMAGVWQELGGRNDVTLHSGGTSFTLDGATRNTVAEFSGGVDLFARDGVSAYLKTNYSTGGVFDQAAVRTGIRWTFGGR